MSAADVTTLPVRDAEHEASHYGVLDGWRGISIALVLCGHLLPLGPKVLQLNEAVASSGMALFFSLSGFLITTFLLRRPDVRAFLIRRLCRIVPLAWLYIAVVLAATQAPWQTWAAHAFFYGNLPPFWLVGATSHLWSLCVEMHFYLGVALIVAVLGRRGLWLLPVLCVAVTGWRVAEGAHISIVTWLRVDEILAGAVLALVLHRWPRREGWPAPWFVVAGAALVLFASAHPAAGAVNYLRPYASAALVGATLYSAATPVTRFLERRELGYLAKVSYALYVIHGGLVDTWLGSGGTVERYLKRPLLVAVLFALAHLSTTRYESRWIELGKRWTRRAAPAPTAHRGGVA